MTAADRTETALKALSMLDLTDLGDQATEDGALALIRSADTGHGFPAAICIWPCFVAAARAVHAAAVVAALVLAGRHLARAAREAQLAEALALLAHAAAAPLRLDARDHAGGALNR